jgi:hypothetical protein
VLLLAATSAPGWLWRTEFGGYDALSYHLQLPKEWFALGAITPLEHNVYSFLPSYVEGAYYHLMVLRGDSIGSVYAAQLLHASFALLAAWLIYRITFRLLVDDGSAYRRFVPAVIASAALIGTPWVVVTGSLAYNEMAVLVMLAGGLLALCEPDVGAWRRGTIIGLLAATACGAKLTAVGFVAVPLVVVLLMIVAVRHWHNALLAGVIAGAVALSPYLINNAVATGNPVFPFAAGIFGVGHWDDEQIAIWNQGHFAGTDVRDRACEAWRQLFRYGIGPNPYDGEPWVPQWSIMSWLALGSILALLFSRSHRTWGIKLLIIMLLQILFWFSFTHIKSRFMLPMVVPGTIAAGLFISVIMAQAGKHRTLTADCRPPIVWQLAAAAILLIWSCVPVAIFAREANGGPAAQVGSTGILTGDALDAIDRETLGRGLLPTIYINHLLPSEVRVLFIGEAAPLYYHHGRYDYQTTWDRGPMSLIMNEYPDKPHRWVIALRERGYTHVFINPVMLRIWEDAGWNDPNLTVDRVLDFAESQLTLDHTWPRGERLYRMSD